MHKVILGLQPLEPGWREFRIAPVPGGGLDWAEGGHVSSYGECSVRWMTKPSQNGDPYRTFTMLAKIPPNSSAQVQLPGEEEVRTVKSGTYTWEIDFVPDVWPPRAEASDFVNADDEL
jgi:alpha-L-rhamnosidase